MHIHSTPYRKSNASVYDNCEEQDTVEPSSSKETMCYLERITTVEEVPHIASKAEVHCIKLKGHDVRMQIGTDSSVTIISTEMWRKLGSPSLSINPR